MTAPINNSLRTQLASQSELSLNAGAQPGVTVGKMQIVTAMTRRRRALAGIVPSPSIGNINIMPPTLMKQRAAVIRNDESMSNTSVASLIYQLVTVTNRKKMVLVKKIIVCNIQGAVNTMAAVMARILGINEMVCSLICVAA
jgi:hypothetical protein